jgi:hypothetical protein
MGTLDAIAAALGSAVGEAVARPDGLAAPDVFAGHARAVRPILQLNRFPVSIDTATFQNAFSGRNPGGDYKSLFAFQQLVDPVPTFTRSYGASAGSTEQIYGALLKGASVSGDSSFPAGVLSEARAVFESEKFPNLDGTPGVWRPVYATPDDWSTAAPERFRSIDIDLDTSSTPQNAFAMIGDDEELALRLGSDNANGPTSTWVRGVRSVRVEYLLVGLRRPWLHPMVFETNDWFLSGQDAGFCSSGKLNGNRGVLPLIPTGLLLGRNVDVTAEWSAAGTSMLSEARSAGVPVSLGPFLLSAPGNARSTLHIIGWTSDLVPFSPKATKNAAGSVLVDNNGGFFARFSVEWNDGAERRSRRSGNFPVLASAEIALPVNASKIVVKIEIMTLPAPCETWKVFSTLSFDRPVVKKYVLSGTTFDPILKEA